MWKKRLAEDNGTEKSPWTQIPVARERGLKKCVQEFKVQISFLIGCILRGQKHLFYHIVSEAQ